MANRDPRTQVQVIGGVDYVAPVTCDKVPPKDIWRIAGILWFSRQAVLVIKVMSSYRSSDMVGTANYFGASASTPWRRECGEMRSLSTKSTYSSGGQRLSQTEHGTLAMCIRDWQVCRMLRLLRTARSGLVALPHLLVAELCGKFICPARSVS